MAQGIETGDTEYTHLRRDDEKYGVTVFSVTSIMNFIASKHLNELKGLKI
jgi:hypothetical protein